MLNKANHQSGMTLIELIVAMVIIAVGLAGVLSVFNTNVRASADPMIQKQLLAIAEGMLDEVMLLPYAPGSGTNTGCARNNFDDIDDFASYIDQPICDLEGNAISNLSGYTVSVDVADTPLGMEQAGENSKKITVTVTRNPNETLSLFAWRTDWAK